MSELTECALLSDVYCDSIFGEVQFVDKAFYVTSCTLLGSIGLATDGCGLSGLFYRSLNDRALAPKNSLVLHCHVFKGRIRCLGRMHLYGPTACYAG